MTIVTDAADFLSHALNAGALHSTELRLPQREFPIRLISPPRDRASIFKQRVEWWLADHATDPWFSQEAGWGGDNCTVAEMVDRLMTEPIKRPIQLIGVSATSRMTTRMRRTELICLEPGISFLLGNTGNNRLGAAALRGLPTVPAVLATGHWQVGSESPDWAAVWETVEL